MSTIEKEILDLRKALLKMFLLVENQWEKGANAILEYDQDVASAQVKSCLILSALHISGQSKFHEEIQTRDHTENLLEHFGYEIYRDGNSFSLKGRQKLIAKDILIPKL